MKRTLLLLTLSTNLFAASSSSSQSHSTTPKVEFVSIKGHSINGDISIFDQEGKKRFTQHVIGMATAANKDADPKKGIDICCKKLATKGIDGASELEASFVKDMFTQMYAHENFRKSLLDVATAQKNENPEKRNGCWKKFRNSGAWALKLIIENHFNQNVADPTQHLDLSPPKDGLKEFFERNQHVPMDEKRSAYFAAGQIALILLSEYNRRLDPTSMAPSAYVDKTS